MYIKTTYMYEYRAILYTYVQNMFTGFIIA